MKVSIAEQRRSAQELTRGDGVHGRPGGWRLCGELSIEPGSGNTAFLERTLSLRQPHHRVVALVGDLATENEAKRLARSRAPVKQITTGTPCHLEAAMVEAALEDWHVHELDYLFIENVGNLVCPASYDFGEDMRVALIR